MFLLSSITYKNLNSKVDVCYTTIINVLYVELDF